MSAPCPWYGFHNVINQIFVKLQKQYACASIEIPEKQWQAIAISHAATCAV